MSRSYIAISSLNLSNSSYLIFLTGLSINVNKVRYMNQYHQSFIFSTNIAIFDAIDLFLQDGGLFLQSVQTGQTVLEGDAGIYHFFEYFTLLTNILLFLDYQFFQNGTKLYILHRQFIDIMSELDFQCIFLKSDSLYCIIKVDP